MTTKQFNKLSKAKKAVLVAKDVLEQLRIKRYIATSDVYINLQKYDEFEGQINENFNKIKECQTCALGSMLLSCTHLGNKLTTDDVNIFNFYNDNFTNKNLQSLFSSIFDTKQLLLIETAFEGYEFWIGLQKRDWGKEENFTYYSECTRYATDFVNDNLELSYTETVACQSFYNKYRSDNGRLKAICNNIIDNNGTFLP